MVNRLIYFVYILIAKQLEVQVIMNCVMLQARCFDTAPLCESYRTSCAFRYLASYDIGRLLICYKPLYHC